MAQDWDIKPRDEACRQCETAFADQQAYTSLLLIDENGYSRRDFCESCGEVAGTEVTSVSSWRGVFKLPPPAPEEPLKKENAESLLRRFMESESSDNINVVYILAIMLERKRLLIEQAVQTRDDGTLIRVYEHRQTGESFLIPDPRLQLNELEAIQDEVAVLLGAKPRQTQPEATAAEDDAGEDDDDEFDEDDDDED
ncbi:MAG: hypothetical protein O3A51_01335 [Verrucomicrobia bacterium]|nr:hypothetical protein [Verrucomicrobiota bacterium]